MNEGALFERAMGDRFVSLPPALQRFHRLSGRHELHGVVETDPPASATGRALACCLGSPRRSASGAIRFELDAAPDVEMWTRYFPGRTRRARLSLVDGFLVERMGPARLVFALDAIDGGLRLRLQARRFLGIPCPAWPRPRIVAEETGDSHSVRFHVETAVRGLGRVVGDRGHLVVPAEMPA